MFDSVFFADNQNFQTFGNEHLITVLFFVVSGTLLIRWAMTLPEKKQHLIGNIFAFSLAITVLIWAFLKIYLKGFEIQRDLPLNLCNLIALLLPVYTLTRKKLYYEIMFFWVLAGTTHAVITPDLNDAFPHYVFLKYWYVHVGLIIFVFYATFVYKMRPTFKSPIKSYLALQAYIVLMFAINYATGSNYFYTFRKPNSSTALDYLGEWPYYIFVIELFMIPYFFLFYLPFFLKSRKIKND